MSAEVRVSSVYTPDGHLAPDEAWCRAFQTDPLYRPTRWPTHTRAEIRPSRYKRRTSRHGTPLAAACATVKIGLRQGGMAPFTAGRSDRRRDVSARLESQPG